MADECKTLPIGTIFTYNGNKYKVCNGISCSYTCTSCAFHEINCDIIKSIRGYCTKTSRTDHIQAYYEQINNETMKKDSNNIIYPTFNTNTSLNDLHVECPKGYSIDVEHSDLSKGIIKFKNDNITLEDIYDNQGKDTFITNVVSNNIHTYNKMSAIAKLMDIANYYNVNWKPDWNNKDRAKYCISFNFESNSYSVTYRFIISNNVIYFNNERDAQAVIDNPNFRDILDAIYKH